MNAKSVLIFAVGAVLGSAATWLYLKKKYESESEAKSSPMDNALNELSVSANKASEAFSGIANYCKNDNTSSSGTASKIAYNKEYNDDADILADKYSDILNGQDYTNEPKIKGFCFPVSPDEFGDIETYDQTSLTYFSDGVLYSDTDYKVVENPEKLLGNDWEQYIGIYDYDVAYIRNDRFKCYYEVLRDNRAYSDVSKSFPPQLT